MRTLIIDGSTRQNGDCAALLSEYLDHMTGECLRVSFRDGISPCTDCRWCWEHPGCAIKDGMQRVYEYLESCDRVVLVSPIWFSSLSGPALNILSRFQTNFMGWFRRREPKLPPKRGVLILAGAQPGTEEAAIATARIALGNVGVKDVTVIRSMNTDRVPAQLDAAALAAVRAAAEGDDLHAH